MSQNSGKTWNTAIDLSVQTDNSSQESESVSQETQLLSQTEWDYLSQKGREEWARDYPDLNVPEPGVLPSMITPITNVSSLDPGLYLNIPNPDTLYSRKRGRPVTINNTCLYCKYRKCHESKCTQTYTLDREAFEDLIDLSKRRVNNFFYNDLSNYICHNIQDF